MEEAEGEGKTPHYLRDPQDAAAGRPVPLR
jgi:hypothetical protein